MREAPTRNVPDASLGHLLLVEDQSLLAELLLERVGELGYHARVESSISGALAALDRHRFDGGLLDLNLHGESIAPVADEMLHRGIKFAFLSGYDPMEVPPGHRRAPFLQKPFTSDDLVALLAWFTEPRRLVTTAG